MTKTQTKKQPGFKLPVDVLRDLKIRALQEGRGISDLAAEIIVKYLAKVEK